MILVGEWRAKQRHNPVAHHLVDRALVTMDRVHHTFEHGIEKLARLLGIAVGEQLHRALEAGEAAPWIGGERGAAGPTELLPRRERSSTARAGRFEPRAAVLAEARVCLVLSLAAGTLHPGPPDSRAAWKVRTAEGD